MRLYVISDLHAAAAMSKQKPTQKKTAEIALHEAGHAVVALALGYVVTGAEIDPEKDRGRTGLLWLARHPDPLCEGIVAWAGAAAEGVDYLGESGDYRTIKRYHFSDRSFVTLREFAVQMVDAYRPAIDAVASVLRVKKSIPGETIRRLAFNACPDLRKEARPVSRDIASMARVEWRNRGRKASR